MLGILLTAILSAQTLTVQLKPNTPFTIQWEQVLEGNFTFRYRFWCNGAIVKNFAMSEIKVDPAINPTDRTQVITTTAPGLPAGKHECLVSAFDEIEEKKSDSIPVVVSGGVTTPLRLKILVEVKGGGQ